MHKNIYLILALFIFSGFLASCNKDNSNDDSTDAKVTVTVLKSDGTIGNNLKVEFYGTPKDSTLGEVDKDTFTDEEGIVIFKNVVDGSYRIYSRTTITNSLGDERTDSFDDEDFNVINGKDVEIELRLEDV